MAAPALTIYTRTRLERDLEGGVAVGRRHRRLRRPHPPLIITLTIILRLLIILITRLLRETIDQAAEAIIGRATAEGRGVGRGREDRLCRRIPGTGKEGGPGTCGGDGGELL